MRPEAAGKSLSERPDNWPRVKLPATELEPEAPPDLLAGYCTPCVRTSQASCAACEVCPMSGVQPTDEQNSWQLFFN
eukprot:2513402-Amphidinium_carterae.1